jgi:formylglycine-generating enzyme required for sulfatase activity
MAGNIMEWTATPYTTPEALIAQKDFTPFEEIVLPYADFRDERERLCCGSRLQDDAGSRDFIRGFRIAWSLAAQE